MDGGLTNPGDPAARPAEMKMGTKKPRSELMPVEVAKLDAESAKRRNRRAKDKEKKVAAGYAAEAAAQHQADVDDKEAIVTKAHENVSCTAAPRPWQTRFSTSPDCSVVAPAMLVGVIDINVKLGYSGAGQSSNRMQRKQPRSFPSSSMAGARRLFDKMPIPMPTARDLECSAFMENIILEGLGEAFHVDGHAQAFDPDATQRQDGRGHYEDTQFAGHDEDED